MGKKPKPKPWQTNEVQKKKILTLAKMKINYLESFLNY